MIESFLGHARGVRMAIAAVLMWGVALNVPNAARADEKADEKKPDYKPFEEVTEGYELIDGFFPLYHNKKTDNLLAVIPKAMIGDNFLMARSVAGGGSLTGYQLGHSLVRWEMFNKKMILVEPELRHLRGNKSTVQDVIDRTYADAVELVTPIVTMRGGDPVIDLDKVFKRDLIGLGRMFGGSIDPSISKWIKTKGFKDNVELAVEAVYMTGEGNGTKSTVHYSISRLPKSDYEPRAADDRIGYFLTARKDWTSDHNAKTTFQRNVHRWHLRKADPTAEVSDVNPDDQIVFYIEKTVPVQYRRYIREGILMWNSAFEKAGLRNVMQVRQQTDESFADLDPEDVNYNFFRWIVSGRSFAMGPSRANPLTGEILDADIIMDDSMARVWYLQYQEMTAKGPSAYEDPQLAAFFEAHPEYRFQSHEDKFVPGLIPHDHDAEGLGWEPKAMEILKEIYPQGICTYANGVAHEMALGSAILHATGDSSMGRDEFVGQWLRLVACHEVGHTLGLRHNFKASSWKSLEEILANEDENVPTTGSVMDYNPAVYNTDRTDRKLYLSQCVGPYDDLAIAYGYSIPAKGASEKEMLNSVAGKVSEMGLDFATDEDNGFLAPDPLVNVYDHTNNPIAWASYRMDLVESLREDILDWAVTDGESYSHLRRMFDMLLFEYQRVTQYATRVIGGQYMHRDHKGDPNARPPVEIVPVEQQRAALDFITKRVFSDTAFMFDPELLNMLAPGRWHHWDSDASDYTQEYPVHDRIAGVQYWALFHLTNPMTIARVYDAELKVPADQEALTVAALLSEVTSAVWSELDNELGAKAFTNRQPYISSIRRGLQRNHLNVMIRMVLSSSDSPYPADAIALARMMLSDLAKRMDKTLNRGQLDEFSRAHLIDAKTRIEKALEAGYEL